MSLACFASALSRAFLRHDDGAAFYAELAFSQPVMSDALVLVSVSLSQQLLLRNIHGYESLKCSTFSGLSKCYRWVSHPPPTAKTKVAFQTAGTPSPFPWSAQPHGDAASPNTPRDS